MPTTINNSHLKPYIKKHVHLKIGNFYFFDDFVGVEYAEDSHVSMEELESLIEINQKFYPEDKPFGLIINKSHRYSTVPSDAKKLEDKLPNLVATAVVVWNTALSVNFELENHFFKKINRQLFPDLKTAETWILQKVEASKQ